MPALGVENPTGLSREARPRGAQHGGLRERGVEIEGEPVNEGWGINVMLWLPGGVEVMLREPSTPWQFGRVARTVRRPRGLRAGGGRDPI